jgi:hypothetical protein
LSNHQTTILLAAGGLDETSLKVSRIELLNHCDHSPYQSIGRPFSLSQRRAGVRENRSKKKIVRFIVRED